MPNPGLSAEDVDALLPYMEQQSRTVAISPAKASLSGQ
jgi:hypothetical protein